MVNVKSVLMKGKTFVDMFRMHWNSTVGQYHHEYFDSIKEFSIQYVFGKYYCIPEYCTREQLAEVLDAILSKSIYLYLHALEMNLKGAFDIEFDSIMDNAELYVKAGGCVVFIIIEPQKFER